MERNRGGRNVSCVTVYLPFYNTCMQHTQCRILLTTIQHLLFKMLNVQKELLRIHSSEHPMLHHQEWLDTLNASNEKLKSPHLVDMVHSHLSLRCKQLLTCVCLHVLCASTLLQQPQCQGLIICQVQSRVQGWHTILVDGQSQLLASWSARSHIGGHWAQHSHTVCRMLLPYRHKLQQKPINRLWVSDCSYVYITTPGLNPLDITLYNSAGIITWIWTVLRQHKKLLTCMSWNGFPLYTLTPTTHTQ